MPIKKGIIFLLALFALVGCETDLTSTNSNFEVTLIITNQFSQPSSTFTQGETINISLALKNISSTTQTLNFSSSQQYDFVIKDVNGVEIWRWSDGMVFIAATTSYSLSPGESQVFSYSWDQNIPSTGTVIPVGTYLLEAQQIGIDVTPQQTLSII